MLKTLMLSLAAAGAMAVPLMWGAPADAQASRTWISGVGDDVNPCSRTAPCKTFAGAISKTAGGGEINCLDAGGFGAVTITKSITLDCSEMFGSLQQTGGANDIVIMADNTAAPVVRLRNVHVTGVTGLGGNGIRITGANTLNTAVIIEDVLIDGFSLRCITDERTGGGKLIVSNVTVRDCGGTGVNVGGVKASIDRLRAFNTAIGVAVGTGGVANIANSQVAGSTSAGIETEGTALAIIDTVVITNSTIGVQVVGGSTVALSNSELSFNKTGAAQGTLTTYTTNRIFQNGAGTFTLTLAPGGNTDPSGLQ